MKTKFKNPKKILSVFLCVLILFSCVPMSVISASAEGLIDLPDLTVTIDTGAYVTLVDADEDDYYDIGTADELYAFAYAVNGGNYSINGELTADIVVNEGKMTAETQNARAWTPIAFKNPNKYDYHNIFLYTGTFNGNNHTVSGLYFNNAETDYVGLFRSLSLDGAVENTGVINSYFNGNDRVGGVVGYNYRGTITNCYNTSDVNGVDCVGGVTSGNYSNSTITNCYNTGAVSGNSNIGGVVGYNDSGCKITNCYNTGDVSGNYDVGGVVGESGVPRDYFKKNTLITNCYNTGDVSGDGYVGGVAGRNYGTITNSYNAGEVYLSEVLYNVGGVVGYNESGIITNCNNTGEVSGDTTVGGVVGYNYRGTITNCNNTGKVSGRGIVGGVVGSNRSSTITNSYNTGKVSGKSTLGGVAGENDVDAKITNCYNTGDVCSTSTEIGSVYGYTIGGVVGSSSNYAIITNSYNTGDVSGNKRVGGVAGGIGSTITNCYNTGDVSGNGSVGGVVGEKYDLTITITITNNYYLSDSETDDFDGTTAKTDYQFASGEVAYLLQNGVEPEDVYDDNGNYVETIIPEIWGQKIGTDTTPVLGGDKVYLVKNGENEDSYSNTNEVTGHVEETIAGKEATCTETGLTEGKKCSVCGEILVPQEEIATIPHTEETITGKKPTCTETGLTDGKKCSVCGETLEAQKELPTTSHTEEAVEGKAPSCTETGLTAGTKCTICGETLEAQKELPTTSHTEEAVEGKAPSCTETGLTAGTKCTICGETLEAQKELPTIPHTEEAVEGKAPSCTETGLTDGTKCSVCGETVVKQEIIPATGHSYENGKCTVCGYKDPENTMTLYLKPSSNWQKDNARFTAYLWTGSKNTFIDMTDTDGDGYYELTAEKDWENIIFCRFSPKVETNWDNIWNQTKDLAILKDGRNCFTINEGAWDQADGKWSVYTPAPTVGIIGDIDLTLEETDDNIYTGVIELQAGTYKFNVDDNGTIRGMNFTYTDTATIDYSAGYKAATTLNVTGGRYTFTYNATAKKLTIKFKSFDDIVELFGDINAELVRPNKNTTVFTGTIRLDAGSYSFNVNEHGVIFGRGYTFEDTIYNAEFTFKAAATFNATGGVYSVRYDSSNNQLKILKAPEGLGDVSVFGDFSLPLAAQGNGVFSAQTILDAGSYDFRIDSFGTLFGNGTEFTNTVNTEFNSEWKAAATLKVTEKQKFTFIFDTNTNKVKVFNAPIDTTKVKVAFDDIDALVLTSADGVTFSGTIALKAGTYTFRMDEFGTPMGGKYAFTDTSNNMVYNATYASATTMTATGGEYTFTYNVKTDALKVTKV